MQKVMLKPKPGKVNFYNWDGWDPLSYKVDDVTKRYLVRRPEPTDIQIVLDPNQVANGWEIVWEG